MRENSLPTTLEHKKSSEDFEDGVNTYHRRTLSESFKDKKGGTFSHVQGKRKAPLPPPNITLYPNLQKVNSQCPTLHKKKKQAPPPPENKNITESSKSPSSQNTSSNDKFSSPKTKNKKTSLDQRSFKEDEKSSVGYVLSKNNSLQDIPSSPLPIRPWYKRNHRDSTGGNILKKEFLKGFDKKKKETEDWMPEAGFSRRSFSSDNNHSKFNIFARLDKHDDRKKEEKRKSQISILTNISELDKEAAEIVKNKQVEEIRMREANDAKFYSKNSSESLVDAFTTSNEIKNKEKNNSYFLQGREETISVYDNLNNAFDYSCQNKLGETSYLKKEDQNIQLPTEISHGIKSVVANGNKNITDKISKQKEEEKPGLFSTSVSAKFSNSFTEDVGSESDKPQNFNNKNKEFFYLNEPWVCPKCTLENPGWRVFCEICSSVKPRFLYNEKKITPKDKALETSSEKLNLLINEPKTVQKTDEQTSNNMEQKESLDEWKKKRIEFFGLKSDDEIKNKPRDNEPLANEIDKDKLKKLLKEMKESFPPKKEAGEAADTTNEIKPLKSIKKENIPLNVVESTKENKKHEITENSAKKQQKVSKENTEKVIEAYVITKTTVLEDIIIKKADPPPKPSTSAKNISFVTSVEEKNTSRGKQNNESLEVKLSDRKSKYKFKRPIDLSPVSEEADNRPLEDLEELTYRLTRADGLADFKEDIQKMAPNTEMNTVAVSRLLKKLETAINEGDHIVASGLAKELALLKINCSVTRQMANTSTASKITIDLYVEDKESHHGPIQIKVSPSMTLLQLKTKVQQELGIPINIQRWILGKTLATDDNKTLESDGVKNDFNSIFLYVVEPAEKSSTSPIERSSTSRAKSSFEQISQNLQILETNDQNQKVNNFQKNGVGRLENSKEAKQSISNIQPPFNSANNSSNSINKLKIELHKDSDGSESEETSKKHNKPVNHLIEGPESNIEKDFKLITKNSVKQKVAQLNKTLSENKNRERPFDTWKCLICAYTNYRERITCYSCNGKRPNSEGGKYEARKQPTIVTKSPKKETEEININNIHYNELMKLQDADLVPNIEPFNCPICMVDYSYGKGVTLKDCLHTFCRTCLINTVQYSEDAEVKCPYIDETYSCTSVLQQREIKALVPQKVFELHLAKSVKEAENKIGNAFHCKTPDCKGWCIYEDNVNEFHCPVCNLTNCLTCHAIHTGINCKQYQEKMKDDSEIDADAKKTRLMLEAMVEKGEAMACPKCQVVLMKKWGCDWLKCSMCKTEICWVTRGFRWGPAGKGDLSGGCQCGVKGIKCHPKCNYCH